MLSVRHAKAYDSPRVARELSALLHIQRREAQQALGASPPSRSPTFVSVAPWHERGPGSQLPACASLDRTCTQPSSASAGGLYFVDESIEFAAGPLLHQLRLEIMVGIPFAVKRFRH